MNLFGKSSATPVSITPGTILFTIAVLLGMYFLFLVHEIVIILFLAIIVMSAVSPGVRWMERKLRFPKPLGMLIMYSLLISFLVMTFVLIIPPLVSEVPNFINTLNLPPLPDDLRQLKLNATEMGQLFTQFRTSFSAVYGIITSTFSGIFTFFTILVLSSYLLLDRENLPYKVQWFTRNKHHMELAKEFLDRMEMTLGGWVRGQLFLMLVIGVVTYLGLALMNVPYALPLALLAGLLEMLPNLGPTISAIPAIAIAFLSGGPIMGGIVLIFYIVVQQLENNLIVPKIMKDNADVNPLPTILVILIGLKLGGVMGALLAVPIYIVFRTAYSMWLREHGSSLY